MKNGWQITTLGDCCELTSGGTPSKDNPRYWIGDVPFVSARDLKFDRIETAFLHISKEAVEQSATKLAPIGSLLMLVRGMGLANGIQVGEVTAPVAFNQDIRAIHPPLISVLPRFLLLSLRNSFINGEAKRVLSSAAHGTLKIDTDVLRQIAFPLPPLPEQQRIVGILDEAFEGIATAKASAEINLQNARALFESHLQSVFTQRGAGWVEKRLVEVCVLQRGFDLPTRSRVAGEFPLVSSSGIIDTHNDGPVKGPGVATGRSGSIGNVFYIDEDFWPLNTVLYVKEFYGNNPKLIYRLLRHFDLKKYATGTGVPTLNRNFVHDELVLIPESNATQSKIAEQLDVLESETQRLASLYERKLAALDALKKSLLHRAFSGEL